MIAQVFLAALAASVLPFSDASGCHGKSRFRLEPVHQRSGITKKEKEEASLEDTTKLCAAEYGKGATMLDLDQMEDEFPNPADLQHALNPLFQDNPDAVYYIANFGEVAETAGRYALKKETDPDAHVKGFRVAGQVFLEVIQDQYDPEVLCYIPKPDYDPSATMTMSSSNSYQMSAMEYDEGSSSSSSWTTTLLSMVAIGAVGVVAYQKYKSNQAQPGSTFAAPSLDLGGGSYRMLSANENDLAEQLAPSSTELI